MLGYTSASTTHPRVKSTRPTSSPSPNLANIWPANIWPVMADMRPRNREGPCADSDLLGEGLERRDGAVLRVVLDELAADELVDRGEGGGVHARAHVLALLVAAELVDGDAVGGPDSASLILSDRAAAVARAYARPVVLPTDRCPDALPVAYYVR